MIKEVESTSKSTRKQEHFILLKNLQQLKRRWIGHIAGHQNSLRDILEDRTLVKAARGRKQLHVLIDKQLVERNWRDILKLYYNLAYLFKDTVLCISEVWKKSHALYYDTCRRWVFSRPETLFSKTWSWSIESQSEIDTFDIIIIITSSSSKQNDSAKRNILLFLHTV